ncbi:MAG: DegT/DnrJ/EryC1/StrS family aminotransferase [Gemmatimonadetes bacterium]|nr:DegT/DnrJ/EryC1/StrS family aminotransferase [Gemmatimonadota bacterium]
MTTGAVTQVPMNDLQIQYGQIKSEIDAALAEVIANCSFILGPQVAAFEKAYAEYCGVEHCIGVSNGTDALKLALAAADIGPGDEVITTPTPFGAAVEAILQIGAKAVLADIEPDGFTLDPEQGKRKITEKTKAIVPVHIYGQMADMGPLLELAAAHGLKVIEDAAQAQGAKYRGKRAGAIGDVGCFSFYPGKNLGAYGDAGGLTTSDAELAGRLRELRNHGQDPTKKFFYRELGYNHRMDGFQGAVLGVKLPHLDGWNQRRREVAARYDEGLADIEELTVPPVASYGEHVYHLYVVRVPDRQELAAALKEQSVQSAVQYPHPLHLTDAFARLGYAEGDLPVCEQACKEILSLPMFPDLTDAQVDYVIEKVRQHYA